MAGKSKTKTPLALARQVLDIELAGLKAVRSQLDDQFTAAVGILTQALARRNKLVVVGIGKSGNIGQKMAATFNSTGATSVLLDPANALHGDIGLLNDGDVVLALSYSGESDELINLLGVLKKFPVQIIGLTGVPKSALGRFSDVVLNAAVPKEACPFNLAPTASTAVAMAIGDALAAVWMERRGISPADFAMNHPAGSLGKQLTLTAADLMVPASQLHPLQPHTPLPEVIGGLTRDGIGSGWVENPDSPGGLLGILTDGDLRRALQEHGAETWTHLTAKDLMTADPITVKADVLVVKALEQMEHNRRKPISVLPVVNQEQQLMGLLRLHDLVQAGLA